MKDTRSIRRQIFVLTPEEKKAVACVLGAFALGLATEHYRAVHPQPAPPLTAKQQQAANRLAKAASARAKSARGQAAAATARLSSAPASDGED